MINDLDWKQPAIIGGLIIGIGSAVPGISILNCCFCGWALIGGAVAVKLTLDNSPRGLKKSDGLQIGFYTGLIAALVFMVVATPIILSGVATKASLKLMYGLLNNLNNPEIRDTLTTALLQAEEMGPLQRLLGSIPVMIVQVIFQALFSILGGLLGVQFLEKRTDTPPPPQYYGQSPE